MDMRIPPLRIKILLESNPPKSRILLLVARSAVLASRWRPEIRAAPDTAARSLCAHIGNNNKKNTTTTTTTTTTSTTTTTTNNNNNNNQLPCGWTQAAASVWHYTKKARQTNKVQGERIGKCTLAQLTGMAKWYRSWRTWAWTRTWRW